MVSEPYVTLCDKHTPTLLLSTARRVRTCRRCNEILESRVILDRFAFAPGDSITVTWEDGRKQVFYLD